MDAEMGPEMDAETDADMGPEMDAKTDAEELMYCSSGPFPLGSKRNGTKLVSCPATQYLAKCRRFPTSLRTKS